jgi:hypothetical protein
LSDAATPEAKVVRRELAGVPKVEVVGLFKEKVEAIFWDAVTQIRAEPGRGSREITSAILLAKKEQNMHCDSTFPPCCV